MSREGNTYTIDFFLDLQGKEVDTALWPMKDAEDWSEHQKQELIAMARPSPDIIVYGGKPPLCRSLRKIKEWSFATHSNKLGEVIVHRMTYIFDERDD